MVASTYNPPPPLAPSHVPRDHPIVTSDYSLYTVAIEEMVNTVAGWIDDQVDGATIYGPSRFGKSSGVNHWLQRLLSERCGGYVPMVVWSHTDPGGPYSVGGFYAELLQASSHSLARFVRGPLARHHMLLERWIELASQGGGRFLVLVIDEAQGMSQREWLWLVELHSQLERQRIRLCVISVASLQFFDEAITMALSGGAHVAARFMLATKAFDGIRSEQELAYVMGGYDSGSEWPPGSGLSFTAGLVPNAWDQGFRLAAFVATLMQAMTDCLPPRYAGPINFPMKTVTHACRHVLLQLASGADVEKATSPTSWRQVVEASGHRRLMAVVSATAARQRNDRSPIQT
ncbi:AAA+ ATPase domain-containing protein (plasmid) [Cupriavidus necator]